MTSSESAPVRVTVRALVMEPGGVTARLVDVVPDLDTIGGLVGGYLEAVAVGPDAVMYCDEEGKLRGLSRNGLANDFLAAAVPTFAQSDFIVGPAVVFGTLDAAGRGDGYDHAIPDRLLRVCAEAGIPVAEQPEPHGD